jgi:hypothetical protein
MNNRYPIYIQNRTPERIVERILIPNPHQDSPHLVSLLLKERHDHALEKEEHMREIA